MKISNKNSNNDDQIIFSSEPAPDDLTAKNKPSKKYKLLIVDDENEVHIMTKLVLSDYSYKGSTLEFLSAYSGKEAKKLINDHPDIACILLDVVMEENDSGLEVAKFIRQDKKNYQVRIILRTGQPGKAPEKKIILDYDINDYKEKTELTNQKLFTTITTALRSYIHLVDLDEKNNKIAKNNIKLNEEIAKRIVAESNLTKYNRSLEKMIDNKTIRLKTAIQALKTKEKQLYKANKLVGIADVSSASLEKFESSGDNIQKNIIKIDKYRSDMTVLLEKYETMQNIINSHSDSNNEISSKTNEISLDIDQYKKNIDLNKILMAFPAIIKDSTIGIEIISKAVTDIKLFISINGVAKQKVNINNMLKLVSEKLKPHFSSKIDIQTDFGDIPLIGISEKNMEKAFHEIIKNAFEAIESQGIISISTIYEDPYIKITISDIGQGVSPDIVQNIFKPYVTQDKPNAHGLGLTYARSVIMNNKGTLDISSTLNEGTNVTIRLNAKKG